VIAAAPQAIWNAVREIAQISTTYNGDGAI
jgi:hypothetical protein